MAGVTHLDRLLRKQQIMEQQAREIEEQELEGHFRGSSSPVQPLTSDTGTITPEDTPEVLDDDLLKPLPGTRWDRGTPLATEFAIRFGLRDPNIPYQPVPPVFHDDTRQERRARRRRQQILRSYSRTFATDREPPPWATTPNG